MSVDLVLMALIQNLAQCEYLVDACFARSEAALQRSKVFKLLTDYARKNLIYNRKEADSSVVSAYPEVSLFKDRIENAEVSINLLPPGRPS